MKDVYPQPIQPRTELNLRQGIKPSMPEIKQLIALILSFYLMEEKAVLEYGEPGPGGKITLEDELKEQLISFFKSEIKFTQTNVSQFSGLLNGNPLITAQMEPLQVAAELFFRLCRLSFVNWSGSSVERKGGVRYSKRLHFTTNCEIVRISFSLTSIKPVLFNWLDNSKKLADVDDVENKLARLLTIFSEETQFKIRQQDGTELYFQQEGIYKKLKDNQRVESRDSHESVGPYRILNNVIKSGLHAYLKNDNGFALNDRRDQLSFDVYREIVTNTLDISPKKTTIILTELPAIQPIILESKADYIAHNKIIFGPPGTGKSSKIKRTYANGHRQRRVTFHPDYEYASFVGTYKPKTDQQGNIRYEYVPQEFVRIYTDAWNDPTSRYFLIIEEINRGNCAQIFGDLFQILDRDSLGFSEYEVDADTDLADYLLNFFTQNPIASDRLADQLQKHNCPSSAFNKIILPDNLYLYATMNTSDQSLFPMDSAFKRRWDWEYVPIEYNPKDDNGNPIMFTIVLDSQDKYNWANFVESVNKYIYEAVESEDKQLGFWFVKPRDGKTITEAEFKSKVLFYLWFDVFRNEPDKSIFPATVGSTNEPFGYGCLFDNSIKASILDSIMQRLGLTPLVP